MIKIYILYKDDYYKPKELLSEVEMLANRDQSILTHTTAIIKIFHLKRKYSMYEDSIWYEYDYNPARRTLENGKIYNNLT